MTAYGIAGDGINEFCPTQKVITTYPTQMAKQKNERVQKAKSEGKAWKGLEIYKEEVT